MKRVNPHWFYQLANIVHPLGNAAEGASVPQLVWSYKNARDWLRYMLGVDSLFTLVVCRDAADDVILAIDDVIPINSKDFGAIPDDRKLTWAEAYRLRQTVKDFETVFAAEMPTFDTYMVSKKGIYSTADLVERSEMAIDEKARAVLSDDSLKDFNQAGRCLAFELATAAGFHTMRAVEAVLRTYHSLVIKPISGGKTTTTMGGYIHALRKAGEDPKLMDILDHIRDLHRNTIMHPEAFLTMTEALRLFDIAKSAISGMADRIDQLTAAAAAVVATPPAVPIAAPASAAASTPPVAPAVAPTATIELPLHP